MKGYKHLNREQRYTIAQMYKQGSSLRTIAQTIEVSASTVSRELRRNRHKQGYTAPHADMLAQERIEWRRCISHYEVQRFACIVCILELPVANIDVIQIFYIHS